MHRTIIKTADQSNTIYLPELDETFHSTNGALQESLHVFIQAGFDEIIKIKNQVSVFEVGFGTGLNAVLTLMEAEEKNILVSYTGIEAFPLPENLIRELAHKNLFDLKYHAAFDAMHDEKWNKKVILNDQFGFEKVHAKLEEYVFNLTFDLVYFDAFAPDKQPELWTEEIFRRIFEKMNEGGILVTYAAKGEVRRKMQRAGFTVERLPGAKGKREMLRGRKSIKKEKVSC